jgi:hypothetical protein
MDFMRLAHGNMAAVTLTFIQKIVAHAQVLTDEKDLALAQARPCLPRRGLRFGGTLFCSCLLVVHEQRKKQNDRKRNSD